MAQGLITLNDLMTKFKSAGQYTVIVDNTRTARPESVNIVRLIPGFSKSGNWNAPFFINRGNYELAENLYGKEDQALERKGSFFHRTLMTALEEGDVLALNLLNTVDEVDENGVPTSNADVVNYISMSLSPIDSNGIKREKLYSSFYNKERFWSPSPEYLLATRAIPDQKSLLNFVNLGQRKVSVLVRKTTANGYNQTAREWYGGEDKVPAYVKASNKMREYFVDVIILAGDFSDFNRLKNDVRYAPYFDQNGLKINKLNDFLNDKTVTVLNMYTGSLIPNLKDTNGNRLAIDNIINRQTSLTGLLCSLDRKEFDRFEDGTQTKHFDLVGHDLISTEGITDLNFLSYKKTIQVDFAYENESGGSGNTVDNFSISSLVGKFIVNIPNTASNYQNLLAQIKLNTAFMAGVTPAGVNYGNLTAGNTELYVSKIQQNNASLTIELTSDEKKKEKPNSGSYVDLLQNPHLSYHIGRNLFFIDNVDNKKYIADIESPLYLDWKAGKIKDGDKVVTATDTFYLKFAETKDYDFDGNTLSHKRKMLNVSLFVDQDLTTPIGSTVIAPTFGSTFDSNGINIDNDVNFINIDNGIHLKFTIDGTISENKVYYYDSPQTNPEFVNYGLGDKLVGLDENGNKILTEITNIYKDVIGGNVAVVIETTDKVFIDENGNFILQLDFSDMFDNYNIYCLDGFTLKEHHMPNGSNSRMKEIYSMMTEGNIAKTLVDPDFVQWRYLIDTFNGGLEPQSKRYLSMLVKRRQKAIALINMPSAQEFRESTDPRFTSSPTASNPLPTLDVAYIKTGGNLQERPSFRFSLPSEPDGSSFAGWFFPNQIVIEDGDEVSVPPAMFVGNAFMRKWNNSTPFIAVAGGESGVLTGSGLDRPEIHLDKDDRGELKELGVNPIYKRGNQILIYGNSTGYQEYSSILNHIHARDTLITMEIDIENMLRAYEFKSGVFSDETLRTLIETSLNNYLENMRDASRAIVNFKLTFDRTNNPDWVVTNGAAIVDAQVELPEVTDRFITRISLNRAGAGVSVGAFSAV